MAKPKKYIKGPPVRGILELAAEIMEGNYVFWRDKPQHPAWIGSMPLLVLAQCCRNGTISFASINPEWVAKENKELESL